MKTNTVGRISRILFKIYIHLRNKFDPRPKILEEEIICYKICHKLITNSESEFFVAPLSHKRYIKNDKNKMFVVIEPRVVSVINHIYSYTIYCEDIDSFNEMIKHFDSEMENKRLEIENDIRANIRHSLKTILNSMPQ